ncbi:Auxin-responsive protein SAUR32 [Ananas comosus]|uniref:Auxin-responsive protein SAUR32 n=1 Tax=Ananas comosus TaxID=4615 RepID=A0A199VVV1_ANACO|nr:Auxin-responsive protein SAUR32 [Ananas comosus]
MFLGMDSISKETLQQHHSWKNLHLHWPWPVTKLPLPPKGHVAVSVGAEGERRRRFVVPVGHLVHPLFAAMLDAAEAEFGFHQTGRSLFRAASTTFGVSKASSIVGCSTADCNSVDYVHFLSKSLYCNKI